MSRGHLGQLEDESIYILREVAASFQRPVLLYSIGKDSSVLVHLARKAFHPAPLPFPLLHVDTGYKFPEMISFRDSFIERIGAKLIVHRNEAAIADGAHPSKLGVERCCGQLKTTALLQALAAGRFDAAIGGARRDEERSRAKERIFSFRDEFGQWNPRNQRPEPWNLYNTHVFEGQHMRVFPLSNWTEADIWDYIREQQIDVVPLYFAAEREVVERDGILIPAEMVELREGEAVCRRTIRFRSLGCSPCTGAVESSATTLDEIYTEVLAAARSERENRVIDHGNNSMEDKKVEGYF